MLHHDRAFTIVEAENAGELAQWLTNHTWCACNGFRFGGYLFLNDSTSPDGAQEFAVFKGDRGEGGQIESITFSWCSLAKARRYIDEIVAGKYTRVYSRELPNLDHPEGYCPLCA